MFWMNALMNVNHFKETEVSWKSYKARINQVKSLDQKLVRTVKDKDDQTLKTYVSTHNPRNIENFQWHLQMLKRDEHIKEVLEPYKIIKSKRQPKHLKKLLMRAIYTMSKTILKYYDVIAQTVDCVYI